VPKIIVRGDVVKSRLETQGSGADFGIVKIGGSARESQIACAGRLGSLSVGGDITGITGKYLGRIEAGSIGSVLIKGSLRGGDFSDSGVIFSAGKIGTLSILGDIIGGSDGGDFTDSGVVRANGDIGRAFVRGSIYSASTPSDFHSTGIRTDGQLGSVVIGGSLVGGSISNMVSITGFGDSTPTASTNVAIGSVKIGGSAILARIAGGVDNHNRPNNPNGANGDAQLGSVTIAGDFVGASIHTGVATGNLVGNADDVLFAAGNTPGVVASIAKIVIGGTVRNTDFPGVNESGMSAEHIGALQIGGAKVKLNPLGAAKDRFGLGDFTRTISLWEV
jgi:hypothetical protein